MNVNYPEKFGFDPYAEAIRLNQLSPQDRTTEFTQQVISRENHVRDDEAVSILYKYWLSPDGDIYTSPNFKNINNVKNQINFGERNGLFYEGVLIAAQLAVQNPNQLVALYSPTGKKLFHDTSLEGRTQNEIGFLRKPYDLGQLYFMYYDGTKLNNIAVSIDRDDNLWFTEIYNKSSEFNQISNEELRISKYLLNPVLLEDVDNFLNMPLDYQGQVFKNVHGKVFTVEDVLKAMRSTFAGNIMQTSFVNLQALNGLMQGYITPEKVSQAYIGSDLAYMAHHKTDRVIYGGGCGGSSSTGTELENLLHENEIANISSTSSFSSDFRAIRQNQGITSNSENSDRYDPYPCPHCGGMVKGEIKNRPETWEHPCQHCGKIIDTSCRNN